MKSLKIVGKNRYYAGNPDQAEDTFATPAKATRMSAARAKKLAVALTEMQQNVEVVDCPPEAIEAAAKAKAKALREKERAKAKREKAKAARAKAKAKAKSATPKARKSAQVAPAVS